MPSQLSLEYQQAYNSRLKELLQSEGLPRNSVRAEFITRKEMVEVLNTPALRCARWEGNSHRFEILDGVAYFDRRGLLRGDAITVTHRGPADRYLVGIWNGEELVAIAHLRDELVLQFEYLRH